MAMRTSRAFLGAYLRGRRDFQEHKTMARNPYPEHVTSYHNGVTFSRSFRRFWQEGYEDEKSGADVRYQANGTPPAPAHVDTRGDSS